MSFGRICIAVTVPESKMLMASRREGMRSRLAVRWHAYCYLEISRRILHVIDSGGSVVSTAIASSGTSRMAN